MLEEFYNRMTGGEVIATVFERAESQVFNTVLVYIIWFYSIQLKLDPIPTDMGGGVHGDLRPPLYFLLMINKYTFYI